VDPPKLIFEDDGDTICEADEGQTPVLEEKGKSEQAVS